MSEIKFNVPVKYKDICAMFNDEEKKSTNSKKAQLKKWNKRYLVTKDKTWYTIVRPLTEVEMETANNVDTEFQKFLMQHIYTKDIDNINNNGGVYKIYYNNYIYIGQTNNFRRRIYNHKADNSKAYQLLLKGGIFEIVKIESNKESRLILERDLIEYYSNNKDFICINDDYNCNRSFVNRDRKPKYKKVKFNYDEWKYIKNILDKENIYYESI